MGRPCISRSIKRNRIRELGADCSEAGQENVPSSSLFAAAGEAPRKSARKRSRVAPERSKPRTRRRP